MEGLADESQHGGVGYDVSRLSSRLLEFADVAEIAAGLLRVCSEILRKTPKDMLGGWA